MTHYVWECNQVVGEYNGANGAMLVSYSYAGSRLIGKNGGSTQVLLSDRLSTRVALSDVGVVAGKQATLPFGEDFAESGTQEKHHFASYERDGESGLDYALNRVHSPMLGRFQQADPYEASGYVVDPQSWNHYSYVENDSINFNDPSGLNRIYFSVPRSTAEGATGSFTSMDIPDPSEEGAEEGPGREVVKKDYSRTFDCNKKAQDVIRKMREDFSKFANTVQSFGPLDALLAVVTFGSGSLTMNGQIPITQTTVFPSIIMPGQGDYTPAPVTIKTSVTVYNILPNSFSFVTNPGHPLYPGGITFGAVDQGKGKIEFSINVDAHVNGVINQKLFDWVGSGLEDKIWNNLINNVEKYCQE